MAETKHYSIMNFLKINSFFRFLGRHKIYTAIEVFGLSVSLMFVILIITYARQEMSTDRFHADAERIYMLGNEEHNMSSYGLGELVKERYPEIEDFCYVAGTILFTGQDKMPVEIEGKLWNTSVSFVNENFFNFFSFPLKTGNKDYVMANKNEIVISESYSRKAFGGEDPIGKIIVMQDSLSFVVNGVMKDIRNSVIKYNDILVRDENLYSFAPWMKGNFNNALSTNLFLKEQRGASLASKAEDMRDYFKTLYWFYEEDVVSTVQFIPITEAYYAPQDGYMYNKGDKRLVVILLTVGLLVLIFAVINYINLTVAQAGFRAKEMATRSLLGSSRMSLFNRLIAESTLLTFISFIIGTLFAFVALPYANRILDTSIDLVGMFTPVNLSLVLVAIVVIGFITGFLPAMLISQTKAVDVVKGSFRKKTKMVFSRFFITFQNAITIALMAAALVMITQVDYLIKAPLGYNTENIIEISVMDISKEKIITIADEFRRLSTVSLVSTPAGTPFNGGNNNTIQFEGRAIGFQTLEVDSAFVEMLGIQIIQENHVASDNAFYLSEYALKEQNLPMDAATFTYYQPETPIAGVIKDFQLKNILQETKPILMQITKVENMYRPWNILVQVQGDPFIAYQQVKDTYERLTGLNEFSGRFIDQQVEESFTAQKRTSQIVSIFSAIAILLSLLGLMAMSTYFIQQRSREIGVRKVFGSSNKQILTRLVNTFLNYVFIAFVITTPITWYLMREWLSGYSYRIHLGPSFFIIAGLGCLLISFVTVFWQSYMAANANPVNSIKAE